MDLSLRVDYLPEMGGEAWWDRGSLTGLNVCGGKRGMRGGEADHPGPGWVSGGWISGLDKESAANPDTIKALLQTDLP